jgi:spore maturation protein CgeB
MDNARTLEQNISVIHERSCDSCFNIARAQDETDRVCIVYAKSGHPVAQIVGEKGKKMTLHSMINPCSEATLFAQNCIQQNHGITVMLGSGLGYHIAAFLKLVNEQTVIIIEKDSEMLKEMLSHMPVEPWFIHNKIYFLSDDDPAEILNRMSSIQACHHFLPFHIIEHAPSMRAFPEYYAKIKSSVQCINKINLPGRLRYKKFNSEQLRILILHSKYYLLAEIITALKNLGHCTKVVISGKGRDREGDQDSIERVITEILEFKPDFILTVNHLGFDREGILTQFFTDMEIPYASWYVDSPVFILEDFKKQLSPYLAIFLWDKDYINDLIDCGFEHVYYLPLATDTAIFRKIASDENPYVHLQCSVGFVGNSGEPILADCREKLGGGDAVHQLLDKIAGIFLKSDRRYLKDLDCPCNGDERELFNNIMSHCRERFEPAVTWRATQMYRLSCVRELLQFRPSIYGDSGWKQFLNGGATIMSELNYYDELPYFYNVCTVNFNTTSLQMKQGINQRVFDVPACGAFLLTDHRSQIEDVFVPGKEVVCYAHPEEIQDLISFYLTHETDRRRIAGLAYERVRRDHTYTHRLIDLIGHMKRLYG